jgi:hypothetical protein
VHICEFGIDAASEQVHEIVIEGYIFLGGSPSRRPKCLRVAEVVSLRAFVLVASDLPTAPVKSPVAPVRA